MWCSRIRGEAGCLGRCFRSGNYWKVFEKQGDQDATPSSGTVTEALLTLTTLGIPGPVDSQRIDLLTRSSIYLGFPNERTLDDRLNITTE